MRSSGKTAVARAFLVCAATVAAVVFGRGVVSGADVDSGKAQFERCAACHNLDPEKNDPAPTLAGIFGRKAASAPDFRYSAAMRRSTIVWDQETLDTFIKDPQALIPGNRMPFDGIADAAKRDDLLAYLKVAAPAPAPAR